MEPGELSDKIKRSSVWRPRVFMLNWLTEIATALQKENIDLMPDQMGLSVAGAHSELTSGNIYYQPNQPLRGGNPHPQMHTTILCKTGEPDYNPYALTLHTPLKLPTRIQEYFHAEFADRFEVAAQALHNAEDSNIDRTFGVPNKFAITMFMEHHAFAGTGVAQKEQHALFYMDLDNFKLFNEQYGHAEGDRQLRNAFSIVKRIIAEHKRGPTIYGRWYHGDEIVAACLNMKEEEARKMANNIEYAVSMQAVPTEPRGSRSFRLEDFVLPDENRKPVTIKPGISVGYSPFDFKGWDIHSFGTRYATLTEDTDQLMLRRKQEKMAEEIVSTGAFPVQRAE